MNKNYDFLKNFDEETILRLLELAKIEKEKKEKIANKNPNFVQLNKANLPAVAFLSSENGLAAGIYFFLTERMTVHNAVACSYQVLQDYFNASKTSVYNAIKLLKEKNFFQISKMGNTNVYHLNTEIVWQRGYNAREFAEFSAVVVLSKNEQEKYNNAKKSLKKINFLNNNKNNNNDNNEGDENEMGG